MTSRKKSKDEIIDIYKEQMDDIWKALTSPDAFDMVFDKKNRVVCAIVSSPKTKNIRFKKLLKKEHDAHPEDYILIREADNKMLFELAERFRSTGSDSLRESLPDKVTDHDSYMSFQENAKRHGYASSWFAFLETHKDGIIGKWCEDGPARIINNGKTLFDVLSKGVGPEDDLSLLMESNALLQSLTVKQQPIVCEYCGAPLELNIRKDMSPSTVGRLPYYKYSGRCSCGRMNVLTYLNDGYHSGYHYNGAAVPWFEYREYIKLKRSVPKKISSDEEASACINAMREALRCQDWEPYEQYNIMLKSYFKKKPARDTESFDLYIKWVNLSASRNTSSQNNRLEDITSMSPPLEGLDGAEAYAHKCERLNGYDGCPEKAIAILSSSDCDPYLLGYILTLMSPMISNGDEPEGYGDLLVKTLEGIVDDLESPKFRRRWQLSTATMVMEFATEHAHKKNDWGRVLPLVNRMETAVRKANEKLPIEADQLYVSTEDDEVRWSPPINMNGVLPSVMYRLGCYYLTDGNDTKKGYQYMKDMLQVSKDADDFGPVTSSRLILSEALSYRSDKDYDHVVQSVTFLSNLDRIKLIPTFYYENFVYYALSDKVGTSQINLMMMDAGLPVLNFFGRRKFDKEILWEFATYGVI